MVCYVTAPAAMGTPHFISLPTSSQGPFPFILKRTEKISWKSTEP